MKIVFDARKDESNILKHGLSLANAHRFEWTAMAEFVDFRRRYGETRIVGFGNIDGRLHCVVFTNRDDDIRIISLRKANQREVRRYAKA